MHVRVSDSLGGNKSWQSCFSGTQRGFSDTLSADCQQHQPPVGDKIKIQFSGFTFIHVCEVEVYGTAPGL